MRTLLLIASLLPLIAQQATPPAPVDAKPVAKPATKEQTASPVPSAESWLTGSIDLGYRWRTDVAGSFDTYRSIVNLGSGPKLLGADFTLADPNHRAFDQMHIRASSWGDDPYSSFHLDARKAKLYEFNADYRNIAYFNFLPSYADPLLARGIVSTNNPSIHTAASPASRSTCCRETGSSLISLMTTIPAPEPAPRRLFPTATSMPSRTGCTTGRVFIGAVSVSSCAGSMPRWNRAARPSKTIRACIKTQGRRTLATCLHRCRVNGSTSPACSPVMESVAQAFSAKDCSRPARPPGLIYTGSFSTASPTLTFSISRPPQEISICKTNYCFITASNFCFRPPRRCRIPPQASAPRFGLCLAFGSLNRG